MEDQRLAFHANKMARYSLTSLLAPFNPSLVVNRQAEAKVVFLAFLEAAAEKQAIIDRVRSFFKHLVFI